jgi:hypothetical protein
VLAGTRLTVACLSALLALCIASEAARAWLEWEGAWVDPAVGRWLRDWVIADTVRAPGFVLVLGLLFLNLLCSTLKRLRSTAAPGADGLLAGESEEDLVKSVLETGLSPDAFGELARKWSKKSLGRRAVATDGADGARILTVRRGLTSSWCWGTGRSRPPAWARQSCWAAVSRPA